jgi:oxygen-independent coproporphyrinogen III oxidase
MNNPDTTARKPPLPGLYVHVPFCRSKCHYCDFYSVTSRERVDEWLGGLRREARHYQDRFPTFATLYLGGGTPTLLAPHHVEKLFEHLHNHFHFAADAEVTIEANPDDITADLLTCLAGLGVNRISLGVQSFDDGMLRFLGRRHTGRQADEAITRIRRAGFDNVGLDLIYGLPGQSEPAWLEQLAHAVQLQPEHLSCYQLTLDAKTPLGRMLQNGMIQNLEEETERSFFLQTSRFLEDQGFTHYEVSNFARGDRFRSRHNCNYWNHTPYLGLGPGAHSFLDGERWWNIRSLDAYCRVLAEGGVAVAGQELLTSEQLLLETLFLGFRTRDGVAMEKLGACPGARELQIRLVAEGLLRIADGRLSPTPAGMVVADHMPLWFCE